mgnify:CR=1 FL=1
MHASLEEGVEAVAEGVEAAGRRVRRPWLVFSGFVIVVVMLFAGFTSAYIVSNVGQFWVHIEPVQDLWTSNVLIALSSLPMWLSLRAMKQGKPQASFIFLAITFFIYYNLCVYNFIYIKYICISQNLQFRFTTTTTFFLVVTTTTISATTCN